ncbi:MAG: PIN domain-containing protein [Firmicutes bacterium]|nr:PIN domain-containing protein [Bacillota bacterium]
MFGMIKIEKTFFDTNIFIYALDKDMDAAKSILEEAILSDSAVTSAITVMEYCTGIYGKAGDIGVKSFQNFIKDNYIHVCHIDSAKAVTAAKIRAGNSALKSFDALQIAVAIESGCEAFYTNDKRLKKVKGIDLEIRVLG